MLLAPSYKHSHIRGKGTQAPTGAVGGHNNRRDQATSSTAPRALMRGSKGQASHRSRLLTADRERKSTHENMTTTLTKNSAVEPLAPRCLHFFRPILCSYISVSQAPPRSLCYYCYMHIGYFYIIPPPLSHRPFPSYRQSPCCGCSACVFYVALPSLLP